VSLSSTRRQKLNDPQLRVLKTKIGKTTSLKRLQERRLEEEDRGDLYVKDEDAEVSSTGLGLSFLEMKRAHLKSCLAGRGPPIQSNEFYYFGRELGKGVTGKVYQATHILTGAQVAIKCLDKQRVTDDRRRQRVIDEIHALHRCQGHHVVKLYEAFESPTELYLVLEFIDGLDLQRFLTAHGALEEPLARRIFGQVVKAVKHAHSLCIAHRNIQVDNVLLSADLSMVKLCGFSICCSVDRGSRVKDFSGAPNYLAPEVLVKCEHSPFMADMWSLGVLLYAMLHGVLPFPAYDPHTLQRSVLTGEVALSRSLSDDARDLITRLLELMPQRRPRTSQVLTHPWLRTV
jgi:5'-AMP-activated protein kinase catalytic alpha subunit